MSDQAITTQQFSNPTLIRSLVLLVSFVCPFAANMYLPALPALSQHFKVTDDIIELTVTFFILGFGISQLIYGPLSDRFGRRNILLLGILIALIGSVGCALAQSANALILWRFILGCGIGASASITRSILRDAFSGAEFTKAVAQNSLIFSVVPVISPLLGGYVEKWFGWEATFVFIAFFIAITGAATAWLLIETNYQRNVMSIQFRYMLHNYYSLLVNKAFIKHALCAGLTAAGITAYMMVSPFLFEDVLHLSPVQSGWFIALVISGLFIGRALNTLLLSRLAIKHIMRIGLACLFVAGISLLVPGLFNVINLPVIIIPVTIFVIGTGFIVPNAFALSLEPFAQNAGVASALYGSLILLIAFIVTSVVAIVPSHNQILLAVTYLALASGVFGLMLKSF
jgi:DHA1 family 2-module integral membrane pump EmrD-like MFS transporter